MSIVVRLWYVGLHFINSKVGAVIIPGSNCITDYEVHVFAVHMVYASQISITLCMNTLYLGALFLICSNK